MNASGKNNDSFQRVQQAFTRHLRDPDVQPVPNDVESRRMKIYCDLIYNNIQSFLANSFPVIRKIMNDDDWHCLLRDYVKHHHAQTPLFPRMPQEFVRYLEQECEIAGAYPFLAELAHYEWMETSVSLDTRDIDFNGVDTSGNLLEGVPVINPVAVPLSYKWPVHLISPDHLPTEPAPEPTFIIVYRKIDDEVAFMVLNNVSARLIQKIIENNNKSGRDMLQSIAGELHHPEPDTVIQGGLQIMSDMRNKSVLFGTRSSSTE